jgi:hypothetical protein
VARCQLACGYGQHVEVYMYTYIHTVLPAASFQSSVSAAHSRLFQNTQLHHDVQPGAPLTWVQRMTGSRNYCQWPLAYPGGFSIEALRATDCSAWKLLAK